MGRFVFDPATGLMLPRSAVPRVGKRLCSLFTGGPGFYAAAGAATDPFFSSVSLLAHFDGTNGATTWTDSSSFAHTFTARGGSTALSTAQIKFGTASLLPGGSGTQATGVLTSADLVMGSAVFTCECWIFPVTLPNSQKLIFGQWNDTGTTTNWFIGTDGTTSTKLGLWVNGSQVRASAAGAIATGAWQHIAYVRTGGTGTMYVSGASVFSGADSNNYSAAIKFTIGGASSGVVYFTGHIDEFRLTKGVARYTGPFTPPTAPFPNS